MDGIDKVLTPIVIPDVPFPQATDQGQSVTSSTSNGANTPISQQESIFPDRRISYEVMSSALNTKSKKIMQDFSFSQMGALQIGVYQPGVSGDVRITPNGVTARDQSGNTTFALDGDSGDAVFAGQVQEGSTITGEVEIVGGGHILMLDSNDIPSIYIGEL